MNSMGGQYIPTPQEIADFHKKRAEGTATMVMEQIAIPPYNPGAEPPRPVVQHVTQVIEKVISDKQMVGVEKRIQELSSEVGRRKRSARELSDRMFLLMEKYDFDPAEELIKECVAKNAAGLYMLDVQTGNPRLRINTLERLMEYTAPKLKSIEHHGQVDVNQTIVIARYGEDGGITFSDPKPAPTNKAIDIESDRVQVMGNNTPREEVAVAN